MKTLLKFLFVLAVFNLAAFVVFGQGTEEVEQDYTTISVIANIVLTGLGAFLSGFLQKFKSKLGKVKVLLEKLTTALEDNSLSSEEIKGIVKSAKEVVS